MPWINDYQDFHYSRKLLEAIAENYLELYQDGLPLNEDRLETNLFNIAEYKAEFDQALNSLGKAKWDGEIISSEPSDYRQFSRLQRIIIADIIGWDDSLLESQGFYRVSQLRGIAYHWMSDFLNGLPRHGIETRFVAKVLS